MHSCNIVHNFLCIHIYILFYENKNFNGLLDFVLRIAVNHSKAVLFLIIKGSHTVKHITMPNMGHCVRDVIKLSKVFEILLQFLPIYNEFFNVMIFLV